MSLPYRAAPTEKPSPPFFRGTASGGKEPRQASEPECICPSSSGRALQTQTQLKPLFSSLKTTLQHPPLSPSPQHPRHSNSVIGCTSASLCPNRAHPRLRWLLPATGAGLSSLHSSKGAGSQALSGEHPGEEPEPRSAEPAAARL